MATIELSPLTEHFEKKDIKALQSALIEAGSSALEVDDDAEAVLLERSVDEDLIHDLFDRLDGSEMCDVYVPPEFEGVLTIGTHRVGSAQSLMHALEELGEELAAEDDEDEDEDEDEEYEDDEDEASFDDADEDEDDDAVDLKNQQLRRVWKIFFNGAKAALKKGTCLFVHR
jgi:hypothetical protein